MGDFISQTPYQGFASEPYWGRKFPDLVFCRVQKTLNYTMSCTPLMESMYIKQTKFGIRNLSMSMQHMYDINWSSHNDHLLHFSNIERQSIFIY